RASKGEEGNAVFKFYSLGVATHRDNIVYDFNRQALGNRVQTFGEDYNAEVDRYRRSALVKKVDDFVKYDRIVWDRDLKKDLQRGKYAEFTEDKIRSALYRPYCRRLLYFDRLLNAEVYGFPRILPDSTLEKENRVLAVTGLGSEK